MSQVRILMCEPKYYQVVYEINPWMHRQIKVEESLARQQWEKLKNIIEQNGAKVELVEPQPGWPDMVFTANAGLVYKDKVYLSHFKYPERQGERKYYGEWFKQAGFDLLGDENYFFEGAGDALFAGQKLFAASGFRSDKNIYPEIKKMGNFDIELCELVDPYFYHIDTCFCPLNDRQAIWWPGAFSEKSRAMMEKEIELHAIPEEEAKHFACNAVILDKHVIIPSGCDKTAEILRKLGFTPHQTDMSEFIKAGGACKCLTLKL